MGITFSVDVHLPKGLDTMDFNRTPVMRVLRAQAKKVAQTSKRLVSAKGPSKDGQYPGRVSGQMRKHIKVHASKKQDKFWTRVQVDSIENSMFYPAVLNYGSSKRNIKPRQNAITAGGDLHATEIQNAIAEALWQGIKGW
jgi:hypothetical protein